MRGRLRYGSARVLAGAFLLMAAPLAARAATRLTLAAERVDKACPPEGPLGIVQLTSDQEVPESVSRCLVLYEVGDTSEAAVLRDAGRLARMTGVAGVALDFTQISTATEHTGRARLPYAIKQLSSAIRAASPAARV
ncbi:MAG: hypothetical protein ABI610_03490, partial [Acidobacteriota bacterium]